MFRKKALKVGLLRVSFWWKENGAMVKVAFGQAFHCKNRWGESQFLCSQLGSRLTLLALQFCLNNCGNNPSHHTNMPMLTPYYYMSGLSHLALHLQFCLNNWHNNPFHYRDMPILSLCYYMSDWHLIPTQPLQDDHRNIPAVLSDRAVHMTCNFHIFLGLIGTKKVAWGSSTPHTSFFSLCPLQSCPESAVWQHQGHCGGHRQRLHRWHGRVNITAPCWQHEENIHVRHRRSEEKVHLHPSQVPSGELSIAVTEYPTSVFLVVLGVPLITLFIGLFCIEHWYRKVAERGS